MTVDDGAPSSTTDHDGGPREVEWLGDERFAPLLAELLAAVVKQYRVDERAARRLLCESLAGSTLGPIVVQADTASDVRRTRAYKDAASAAKRHVYHALRRYRGDDGEYDGWIAQLREGGAGLRREEVDELLARLVDGHASTRERTAEQDAFNGFLVNAIGPVTHVLDVGCGVQPLRFPFAALPNLQCYAAVDSNRRSIDAVTAFAAATDNGILRPLCDDLSGGWPAVMAALGLASDTAFDVALMLKLVPVVKRQAKELLATLADTPARRWIITGSTTGLAKRTSIARREAGVLRRFIDASGRAIREEFAFGEEFGYVVEPR